MPRALLLAALLALAGCAAPREAPPADDGVAAPPAPLTVASAAFADGEPIPVEHTCDGDGVSPPLDLVGGPAGTATYALLVIDSDVPTPQTPLRDVVHWLVWDVPAANGSAAFPEGGVPPGAVQGANVRGEAAWAGPCPPHASPAHRYVFTLHAVDGALGLPEGAARDELEAALAERSLGTATLTGTYARRVV